MVHMHPPKDGSIAQINASLDNGAYINEVALWGSPLGVTLFWFVVVGNN